LLAAVRAGLLAEMSGSPTAGPALSDNPAIVAAVATVSPATPTVSLAGPRRCCRWPRDECLGER
jgi:hypothetical protein